MRMLDNVIDINYYAVKKARDSNLRHRPVGSGHHGLPGLPVPAAHAVRVEGGGRVRRQLDGSGLLLRLLGVDRTGRRARHATASYAARCGIAASCRRTSLDLLAAAARRLRRNRPLGARMDWDALRARIKQHGMRNSNCVAIAPTATISNIIGVAACIEPTYQNLSVKSQPVRRIHRDQRIPGARPEAPGLWDDVMMLDLKYFDGIAGQDRPRPAGIERAVRDRVRSRAVTGWWKRRRAGRNGSTRRNR